MEDKSLMVVSRDGTLISYDRAGDGPAIVLVAAALSDRKDAARLAGILAERFTVINYDRRGRGGSGDTPPYSPGREVEDIEALVDAAGGTACLFGSSSGAALALEAASRLPGKVTGLLLYEPPFIVDGSHRPVPSDLGARIQSLAASGKRGAAVRLFFTDGMGIPAVFVLLMRLLMPGWSAMTAMAHTAAYDLAVLEGTQTGKPLPAGRWSGLQAPTLVLVGGKSERFFHTGAQALVAAIARGSYKTLEGRDHSALMAAPQDLAKEAEAFLLG